MSSPDIANTAVIGQKMHQQMQQITDDVAYLIELVKDPSRHGELIKLLDPFIDKVNLHTNLLQSKLMDVVNNKAEEFKNAISALEDPAILAQTPPPDCLSTTDKEEWHKLATSQASPQQLTAFKKALSDGFQEKIAIQLQVEKLTEQNMAIKKVLDKIRKVLAV